MNQPRSNFFDWDAQSGTNFFKQFISGFLITVALVGLDQSMMQKTLTVAREKDAKKNVLSFGFFIAFAQTLFLGLGVLMYLFAERNSIPLATANGKFINTDEIYPLLTLHHFGAVGSIAFLIAVTASTFASIDACITALTTSFSYDFLDMENIPAEKKKGVKNKVLVAVNVVMFCIVMVFWNSQGAIITTIFKIAGYTYGPLLGLFLLGLFSSINIKGKWVPLVCVASAVITYLLNNFLANEFQFDVGFMNIFINAALTILFLLLVKRNSNYATA